MDQLTDAAPTRAVAPIALVGPTATGKSALSMALAEQLRAAGTDAEIVNADAMAQYRGMDIGTAKASEADRRRVVHHQIDVLDVTQTATLARYQDAAAADIEALLARGAVPIVVGGSMMYVQALFDDWQIPPTDTAVRARWEAYGTEHGAAGLHARLAEADPAAAAHILPTDERRMVRALEVVELTGRPFAASQPQRGAPRWGTRLFGIDRPTDVLDERIRRRTDAMFRDGLVEEVERLLGLGLREGQTARRAIGYAQVLDLLAGAMTLDEAREGTFVGTRRYVRRQRSWFHRDDRITWLDAGRAEDATEALAAAVLTASSAS